MSEKPNEILLHAPMLTQYELMRILTCVQKGELSVGRWIGRLEERMAAYTDRKYAVAVNCGTSALHLALLCAGVAPNSEVIVSDLTFIAPANAVRYCRAHPIFADIDPHTWQMDVYRVEEFLASCERGDGILYNPRTHKRIAAILPVHILGECVDMPELVAIADKYHLPIIEDCAQAMGAKVGRRGAVACFSFNSTKTVTGGGGGCIVTDDETVARSARHLANQANSGEYVHNVVGFNYRPNNISCAIACAQMERLDDIMQRKHEIHECYRAAGLDVSHHWRWLDCVYTGMPARLASSLTDEHIQSRRLWQPMHMSPAHRGAQAIGGEVAAAIWGSVLCLPSGLGLEAGDIRRVADVVLSAEDSTSKGEDNKQSKAEC